MRAKVLETEEAEEQPKYLGKIVAGNQSFQGGQADLQDDDEDIDDGQQDWTKKISPTTKKSHY